LSPDRLSTALWDVLSRPQEVALEVGADGSHQHERERWARARTRREDRFRSFALAKETESKLARTRDPKSGPEPDPPSALPAADGGQPLELPEPRLPRTGTRPRLPRPHRLRALQPMAADTPSTSAFALDAKQFPLLTSIGRNLTLLAASGEIDPVIGREADIDRVLDVLARRRGNNPLLVGAPGVGKTAVVEGLALALVAELPLPGQAPRVLLEVPTSSLLSGTGVRGALSERIQALRREIADSQGRVLLFIDEIHGVLGGLEGDGLSNELKSALARGELPVIGATTDAEYRRIFERDAALARRFTRIEVSEPSRSDTLAILTGLAPKYAAHHKVAYEPSALEAAVELSMRYLPLRQLPDKAIALMDQAAARTRRRGESSVDEVAVARVVAELAQVPLDRLLMNDREALLELETQLSARVVGQARAIEHIGNALRRSAAGFRGRRPLGTFLFAGPTGVGKTEMAKAISEVLFPGIPFTRIDMSELGESHAVARLLGSPPGYVGHDEGGQLTEAVRHRPYQLVLLDEIEKAHMDVLLALLPLLDEGRLTDGRGRTVDFTNTVIVMTSNLGVEGPAMRTRIGFGDAARNAAIDQTNQVLARVRAALPPELWNRIDEPLCFLPLTELDVAEIARRMVARVSEVVLAEHDVTLELEASAIHSLMFAGGFDPQLGARPMRRTVSRLVEAPLARKLLAGEFVAGDVIVITGQTAELEFTRKRAARPELATTP
jgi:ATP-dependent Clp protease ATP-binding subunit ClpC